MFSKFEATHEGFLLCVLCTTINVARKFFCSKFLVKLLFFFYWLTKFESLQVKNDFSLVMVSVICIIANLLITIE